MFLKLVFKMENSWVMTYQQGVYKICRTNIN